MANLQYRADFIYQNLQIQQNVIGESFRHGVKSYYSWAVPAFIRVKLRNR